MMNEGGKSDRPIVPGKPANERGPQGAWEERVEGRGPAKGNTDRTDTPRTQSRKGSVPSGLERVRQAARRDRQARFTALLHHVDIDRLRRAYKGTNPKAAVGVDEVTWEEYGRSLEDNLRDLQGRVHRGGYRAKPTRRHYIGKADGRRRPLGIPALEDKIVQRAVVEVLQAIYEEDFLGFSYGFRPGRSQHDGLEAVAVGIQRRKVNWVLEVDIRGYFEAIDHGWLMKFLEHRIGDKRLLRLIGKWLKAGVLEDGEWTSSEEGTPQGAVVSPLLANIYLHYVYDLWARQWRKKRASGDMITVRYADDIVAGFQHREEAEQFQEDLRARFAEFGLELHPDKTRRIEFGRFAAKNRQKRGLGKPETFDFLGFTHVCAKDRRGRFQLRRRTIRKRMRAKLKEVKAELKRRMHQPVPEQGRWLAGVLRGYFQYHAVPTNGHALQAFRRGLERLWWHTLCRRSQKGRVSWTRMMRLAEQWLPRPRILHPWPGVRFALMTQGRSRMR